ncbi:RluA family pseudouridine synthase [Candidatus Parcubacteria bacterium]|nr:RluA family pseudouridine synthase [Candidatus Parcubacteria bacterium]
MDIEVIYQDEDVMVVEKPAGVVVFPEGQTTENTLIDALILEYPELKNAGEAPRYGVVHRLDKGTSGLLLVAKTPEALIFLQKQFKNRTVEKKYKALASGQIKEHWGTIHTLIGRAKNDPRKQKAYPLDQELPGLREAITQYNVLERFDEYTLIDVQIKTGRKHQIRCHLAYIRHPVAGDGLYGFKDSPTPEGLERQFLHASYLKIETPSGQIKEFNSDLPEDLKSILITLGKK